MIRVPPKTEQLLRTFARKNPAEAHWIESTRQALAREFGRLIREGVAIAEISEVEELELDAVEESYVAAQP